MRIEALITDLSSGDDERAEAAQIIKRRL